MLNAIARATRKCDACSTTIQVTDRYLIGADKKRYCKNCADMLQPQPLTRKSLAKPRKEWECQECGKTLTAKQAEKAMSNDKGCPKCGGSDIDLKVG
ncbi:MAG: hypothetical protein M0000_07245 [Actinomycetota bacterium]|nr:hypothetical protein [Actinomycetota bacterium]